MKRREVGRAGGFSLVELMVVIAIIGMLAGIVALKVTNVHWAAMQKKVVADVSTFDGALRLYKIETGRWPQALEELREGPHGAYVEDIDKAVLDPWGRHYVYEVRGDGDPPYRLGSYGADGQPGGKDENEDVFPHEK